MRPNLSTGDERPKLSVHRSDHAFSPDVLRRYKSIRAKHAETLRKLRDLHTAYRLLDLTPPSACHALSGKRSRSVAAKRLRDLLRESEADSPTAQAKLRDLLLREPPVWQAVLENCQDVEQSLIAITSAGDSGTSCQVSAQLDQMRSNFAFNECVPLLRLAAAASLLCWLHLKCISDVAEKFENNSASDARNWRRWFARAWREVHETAFEYREAGEALMDSGLTLSAQNRQT